MQIFIYCKGTLHVSDVTAPIIRSTKSFLILLIMGVVTPKTCRVSLQYINICILLQLVGFLLTWNYDARTYELKILFLINFLSHMLTRVRSL